MIALVRTGEGETRHAGLTQFLVDMKSDGLSVKPIANLTGEDAISTKCFSTTYSCPIPC